MDTNQDCKRKWHCSIRCTAEGTQSKSSQIASNVSVYGIFIAFESHFRDGG